jgi:hypothetical protein
MNKQTKSFFRVGLVHITTHLHDIKEVKMENLNRKLFYTGYGAFPSRSQVQQPAPGAGRSS